MSGTDAAVPVHHERWTGTFTVAPRSSAHQVHTLRIVDRLREVQTAMIDAVVCGVFMLLVAVVLIDSVRVWAGILNGSRRAQVSEAPFVLSQLRAEEL